MSDKLDKAIAQILESDKEEITRLRQRVAELEAELEPCRVYMKKGESIVECLERNRSDALRMTVKWNKRGERMEEMRQWMTEFPAYSHRYATMWDQFAAKKDALPWFKDGEPL